MHKEDKFQQIEHAILKRKPEIQQSAKLNQSLGGKIKGRGLQICKTLHWQDVIADEVGTSPRQVSQVVYILNKGSQEQIERARKGGSENRIDKIHNQVLSESLKQKWIAISESRKAEFAKLEAEDRCILLEGEFQDKGKLIESNSVDLVFVDSTYFENTLHLHGPLAEETERILRNGGSYAVYLVPQWKHVLIRKYISDNSNLNECGRWIALMQGSFGSDYPHRMMYQSKDIAWYCKGEKPINPLFEKQGRMMDVIPSTRPDKTTSQFPQSVEEARYIIGYLTNPNDRVVDLMMGEGTTGIAALTLGRRFIGIEKNPDTYRITKAKFVELLSKIR